MDQNYHDIFARLTERQKQCLALVGEGLSSKEIGRQLKLAPSTVDNHISVALRVLDIDDRRKAARLYISSEDSKNLNHDMLPDTSNSRIFFKLPPLGGQPNNLSARDRMLHVIQIALIGMTAMTAIMVVITGIVKLLTG